MRLTFHQLSRADPITKRVLELYLKGILVKVAGYLLTAAGIFLRSIEAITAGVAMVALGWLIIYKAVKVSKNQI